jgi:hypothetical protein
VRRIDPRNFKVATRGTSREINRRIALNLVRERQPISRADLARLMRKPRSAVGLLVNDLIAKGTVFEGATGPTLRGRRPKFLFIDTRGRCVVAVDIRVLRTHMMVTDFFGHQLASVTSFPTLPDPAHFDADLVRRRLRSRSCPSTSTRACAAPPRSRPSPPSRHPSSLSVGPSGPARSGSGDP